MKFNWGTGLAIWLIIFVIAIMTFVTFAFNQDVNLVNKEYYQKGVHYDDIRIEREKGKSQEEHFTINQEGENVVLSFDKDYFSTIKVLDVQFYRPSDRHQDKHLLFETNTLIVSKSDLIKGRYQLNISWEKEGEKYMLEKYFFLK
jgi:hypothetical protein